MTYKLYRGDLIDEDSLRLCGEESSDQTVTVWSQPEDPYEFEQIGPEVNTKARLQYFAMTGERVLFRLKVLGLPVDDRFLKDSEVLSAHPFTDADCTVAELIVPSVQIAMAYVPLTPDVNDRTYQPVLARLYCVAGLSRKYKLPFESAMPGKGAQFAWFLGGCDKRPPPRHESWHLAAGLLMRVIQDSDHHVKRNLALSYVLTGKVDWNTGRICPVEICRKKELTDIQEFYKLTWIMSEKNRKEMKAMTKIECPATLDEAYELIKTMQNHATSALESAVESGSTQGDAIVNLLKCNADPSQSDGIEMNARHHFVEASMYRIGDLVNQIGQVLSEKGVADEKISSLVGPLYEELEKTGKYHRILSYYGGVAQMFFLMAKQGDVDVVKKLSRIYDINATDETGETALDFAKEFKESLAASILESVGAHRRGIYEAACKRMQDIIKDFDLKATDAETIEYICEALNNGCSPNTVSEWKADVYREEAWQPRAVLDSGDDPALESDGYMAYRYYQCRRRRYSTTLFLEALLAGNVKIAEACLKHGGDLKTEVLVASSSKIDRDAFDDPYRAPVEYKPEFTDDDFLTRIKRPISYFSDCFSDEIKKLIKGVK